MVEPNGMKAHEPKSTPNGAKLAAAKAVSARANGRANDRANGPSARPNADAAPAERAGSQAEAAPLAHFDPSMMMLPYLEVSRALLRAHHNAMAMMEANRALTDSLRAILRRQQDLAFEIAEQAMNGSGAKAGGATGEAERHDGPQADGHDTVFHRAAEAVRELGEAMIAAQLNALDTLRDRAREGGRHLS